MLLLGGVLKLFADLCMYLSPMLIDDIVQYVQKKLEVNEKSHNITLSQVLILTFKRKPQSFTSLESSYRKRSIIL